MSRCSPSDVATLYRVGVTLRVIARNLGITLSVAHRLLRQSGQPARPRGRRPKR